MKMLKEIVLTLLIWLFCSLCGIAQSIKSFDLKGEKSYNTITSIEQDTLGFMWIGSDNGIFRFDGYSPQPLIHPMINNQYVNFLNHRRTQLYIGTNEGFYSYDYMNNIYIVCSPLLKSKNIIAYQYNDKYQIIATDRELFFFDCTWNLDHQVLIYKELLNNHITSMVIYKSHILLGTESGLMIISIDGKKHKTKVLYSGDKIGKLFIDSHENLWICRNEEILYANLAPLDSSETLNYKHIAYNHEVMTFFEHAGTVWVGTRGYGISIYKYNHDGEIILKDNLLIDESKENELKNTINNIYKDKESKVWICTLDGIYLYDDEEFSNFNVIKYSENKKNVLSSNIISSIFCDDDCLWIATSTGINKLNWINKDNYKVTQYMDRRNVDDIMAGNKIQNIVQFKRHVFLVSTKNSIKLFDSDKCLFYDDLHLSSTLNKYGMRYVRSTFRDSHDNIWIAFSEGGAGSINVSTGKFTRLDYPEKVKDRHRVICRDKKGNIWLSSDNSGLYYLQLDNDLKVVNTKLYSKSQFEESWITALYIDRQKKIWVGTSNGLYIYDTKQDKFAKVEFPYSRKSAYIAGIIQDNVGNVWAVSLRGIYKINLGNVITYYELNIDQDIVKTWYILGMCINRNGEIFLGGVNGLNFFNPIQITSDPYPHNIYISDVEILNKKILPDGEHFLEDINNSSKLVLSYKDYQFSLSFSSLYYKNPFKIEYAYMLEGFDNDWIITNSSRRYASYSNLKAGTYTFKIKSTNASGIWLDNVRSIQVIVKNAPWRSWWAYLVYTIIVTSILLLIIRIFNLGSKLRHKDALSKWKLDYYTNLSYGFKVPLTLIYAPLQYLLKNYEQLSQGDIKQILHTMSQSVSKLSKQVSQIMELKKIPIGDYDIQLSKVDIIPIIKGIFNLFQDEFTIKHITHSAEVNISSITIIVDITKIEIALYNILEDAISYISEGGRISLITILDSQDYKINIRIIAERNDEGISDVKNLNTRILIAYDYIKIHYSELSVKNIEENRTREYVFGLSLGSSHYTSKEIESLNEKKSLSLLLPVTSPNKIVDDFDIELNKTLPIIYLYEGDKDIDLFIKNIFTNKFKVVLANTFNDAKYLLEKTPSLIIFDITKEDDYKFKFCREVKKNQILSTIPIIFISSLSSDVAEQKAYEVSADIFMVKPFNVINLEARIKQLLDVRTAIKENIRKELIINPKEVLITSDDDKFIANIINIIEENIADTDFNIDILSSKLNISRSTLYRRVIEIMNLSPSDLIRKRRMKRAADLLEHTSNPVSEISYMVGYSDQRYFGQSFKKEFGITPKQYFMKNKH